MKWLQILNDAWYALKNHKLRSFLSMLGIVFGVMAVVAMLAIAEGARHEILDQIEGLGTNSIIVKSLSLTESQEIAARNQLSKGLTLPDIRSLQIALPDISDIAPYKEIQAAFSATATQEPVEIVAVTETYNKVKNLNLQQGRFICQADMIHKNQVCVLGSEASKILGIEGKIGGILRLEQRSYRVIGILDERKWQRSKSTAINVRNYNRVVFIPIGTEPLGSEKQEGYGELSGIWLRLNTSNNMFASASAVRRTLIRSHNNVKDFQIIVPQELLIQAQKAQRIFNLVLGCIAGISLLVGGLGIMNTMLASVVERTKEIGIRRSVGATRNHIIVQFLCESMVLTVTGGCLGIIAGGIAATIISWAAGWETILTVWSILISIIMAGGVGLVSGLYPASRAANLEPAKALRYE